MIVTSIKATNSNRVGIASLYNLLTSVGWVSLGEGNGSSGGMGITGIITTSAYWFVLKHPSHDRQCLISAQDTSLYVLAYSYTANGFSGGTATTAPTQLTGLKTSTSFGATYKSLARCIMAAQNTEPYGWHFINVLHGGFSPPYSWLPTGCMACVPLDGYDSLDLDPYVFVAGRIDAGYIADMALWGTYRTDTTELPGICSVPRTNLYAFVTAYTWANSFGASNYTSFPYNSGLKDGYYQQIDTYWGSSYNNWQRANPSVYKGKSSFIRICSAGAAITTTDIVYSFNSKSELFAVNASFKWDGYTVVT